MKTAESSEIIAAGKWILNSGIQNTEGPRHGGFNSWFDPVKKRYSYVYSEITGYGITTLLYLRDRFGGDEYLDRASAAAEWLLSSARHASGGVKTRDYYEATDESEHYSFDSGKLYSFDNGMVLYGVANLYRNTKDSRHLKLALGIADFLLRDMKRDDGLFYATFDAKTGDKGDSPWKWSSQTGSYHAKLALGFTDLFDITGKEAYRVAVMDLCRGSMAFQEGSGRFVTSRADKSTHLHPHCYSAEGLLYAGTYFGEKSFIDSAEKAVRWALGSQQRDWGVPKKFDGEKFITYYRSDVLAQTLRLAVILRALGRLNATYDADLAKLREKLLTFQYGAGGNQVGGFFYGTALDGSSRDHINSWCTMFALQALALYSDMFNGKKKPQKPGYFV